MDTTLPGYIVDDDAMMRVTLHRLLKSYGYASKTFSSADKFLKEIPDHHEGCLILDICMPGMSGLELQQHLIANSSPMKIVIITANENPQERQCAIGQGAAGFFIKPFDEKALLTLINRLSRPGD